MPFSIGNFQFIRLSMVPIPTAPRLHVESRPGVDGVAIWNTGNRGEPFVVRSVVDAPSLADGLQLYKLYRDLIGEDPVDMEFANPFSQKVAVLDVWPVPEGITAVLFGRGGIAGNLSPSFARVECEWHLIAIPNAE